MTKMIGAVFTTLSLMPSSLALTILSQGLASIQTKWQGLDTVEPRGRTGWQKDQDAAHRGRYDRSSLLLKVGRNGQQPDSPAILQRRSASDDEAESSGKGPASSEVQAATADSPSQIAAPGTVGQPPKTGKAAQNKLAKQERERSKVAAKAQAQADALEKKNQKTAEQQRRLELKNKPSEPDSEPQLPSEMIKGKAAATDNENLQADTEKSHEDQKLKDEQRTREYREKIEKEEARIERSRQRLEAQKESKRKAKKEAHLKAQYSREKASWLADTLKSSRGNSYEAHVDNFFPMTPSQKLHWLTISPRKWHSEINSYLNPQKRHHMGDSLTSAMQIRIHRDEEDWDELIPGTRHHEILIDGALRVIRQLAASRQAMLTGIERRESLESLSQAEMKEFGLQNAGKTWASVPVDQRSAQLTAWHTVANHVTTHLDDVWRDYCYNRKDYRMTKKQREHMARWLDEAARSLVVLKSEGADIDPEAPRVWNEQYHALWQGYHEAFITNLEQSDWIMFYLKKFDPQKLERILAFHQKRAARNKALKLQFSAGSHSDSGSIPSRSDSGSSASIQGTEIVSPDGEQ